MGNYLAWTQNRLERETVFVARHSAGQGTSSAGASVTSHEPWAPSDADGQCLATCLQAYQRKLESVGVVPPGFAPAQKGHMWFADVTDPLLVESFGRGKLRIGIVTNWPAGGQGDVRDVARQECRQGAFYAFQALRNAVRHCAMLPESDPVSPSELFNSISTGDTLDSIDLTVQFGIQWQDTLAQLRFCQWYETVDFSATAGAYPVLQYGAMAVQDLQRKAGELEGRLASYSAVLTVADLASVVLAAVVPNSPTTTLGHYPADMAELWNRMQAFSREKDRTDLL